MRESHREETQSGDRASRGFDGTAFGGQKKVVIGTGRSSKIIRFSVESHFDG